MPDREKRYQERYDLELPVMVTWKDAWGRTREAPATARNISPSGAFLVCENPITKGRAVDLRFGDPLDIGGHIPSRISARATVIRDSVGAEQAGGYGHGIKFNHFGFSRPDGY
jgi:hypothetical protein